MFIIALLQSHFVVWHFVLGIAFCSDRIARNKTFNFIVFYRLHDQYLPRTGFSPKILLPGLPIKYKRSSRSTHQALFMVWVCLRLPQKLTRALRQSRVLKIRYLSTYVKLKSNRVTTSRTLVLRIEWTTKSQASEASCLQIFYSLLFNV